MSNHYTYLLILLAAVAGPIGLSFDRKVAFHTKWRYLPVSLIFPALIYIAWDMYFTSLGVWSFNPDFITGIYIYNLPLEEVLFFFIVPYCCLFIYECIRCYFPGLKDNRAASGIMILLATTLLIAGVLNVHRYYTSWAFIGTSLFIFALFLFRIFFRGFDAISFLVSYLIILLPFLAVNGFLTALPVVSYNDAENLGIRIYTIPSEDVFYGMLLVLMNVALYEKAMKRR